MPRTMPGGSYFIEVAIVDKRGRQGSGWLMRGSKAATGTGFKGDCSVIDAMKRWAFMAHLKRI